MFFARRGCTFGCGGLLILCVALGFIGWFVVIPGLGDALEDGVSDGIATMIADEILPFHSRNELQAGTDVRFSFATINNEMQRQDQDATIRITSSGNEVVIEADYNGQTFDISFLPSVSSNGRLELEPVDDGGWLQSQFTGILSGGFEKAVNEWLDRNDIILTDVTTDGDALVLSVTGG